LSASGPKDCDVVIVGGGIAGLYCALKLAPNQDRSITVLERSPRLGGRIETHNLGSFQAEFGPMRFEPAIQTHLEQLCTDLDVTLSDFTGPAAGRQSWPRYLVARDERDPEGGALDSLNLLRLGVYRMLGLTATVHPGRRGGPEWEVRPDAPTGSQLRRLGAISDPLKVAGDPGAEDDLRKRATLKGTGNDRDLLYTFGFWNALAAVLSSQAVRKIRDQGTFYHLIPDNPNAAEWALFWLRLFKPEAAKLRTIDAGVETLVEKLAAKLGQFPNVCIEKRQDVTAVAHSHDRGRVRLEVTDQNGGRDHDYHLDADQVILALPRWPLLELSSNFPAHIAEDLDAVIGFPLLKAFLAVRLPKSWPTDALAPQQGAWLLPTREVHYKLDVRRRTALMQIYTDHPATEFWKQFVSQADAHECADIDPDGERGRRLRDELVHCFGADLRHEARQDVVKLKRVDPDSEGALEPAAAGTSLPAPKRKQVERLTDFVSDSRKKEAELRRGVIACGIRDWSRPPYGAGCHAWKPGVKPWEPRERLISFSLAGRPAIRNVHVCGEAYSGYQGFIEGALQTARAVIDDIDPDALLAE
jgi:hypothetical protein